MNFARDQLEKYGWKEGKGLGKNEDGMSTAIKPKLKFNNHGLGHDVSKEFTSQWWSQAFNKAAASIEVVNSQNGVQVKSKSHKKKSSLSDADQDGSKAKPCYGGFVKAGKQENAEEEMVQDFVNITDEELYKICEGRTAHRAARHGLKMNGKLKRIAEQDESLVESSIMSDNVDADCLQQSKSKKPKVAEMHAGVEEVEPDPCDLYLDLATLIIEGRIPGITEKGYGEGIHCPPLQGQRHHQCDPSLPECQRQEKLQKHILLLWKNGIPVSVEVLLYPPCCPTAGICEVESSSVPESCMLLEQWIVHMLPRRMPDANVTPRGLIQAVRSFLYFSQLSAWLSLSHGKQPKNIHYRVCVPGDAFSTKFSKTPELHNFPVANVGHNNAMKVMVRYMPRCGSIPTLTCTKHSAMQHGRGFREIPEEEECGDTSGELIREVDDRPSEIDYANGRGTKVGKKASKSGTNKPASSSTFLDAMLGDSLLDPPQSLQMYPKRYQSPSRSGSPSIEAPEHLMLGKKGKSWWESNPSTSRPDQKRSRPQRRPVIERFLKGIDAKEPQVNQYGEFPVRKDVAMMQDQEGLVNQKKGSSGCEQIINNLHLIDPFSFADGEVEMVLDGLKPPTNINAKHKLPPSSTFIKSSSGSSNNSSSSNNQTSYSDNNSRNTMSGDASTLPLKFSPAILSKDVLNSNKLAAATVNHISSSPSKDTVQLTTNVVSHKPISHHSHGISNANEHSISTNEEQGNNNVNKIGCDSDVTSNYGRHSPVQKDWKENNWLCMQSANGEQDDCLKNGEQMQQDVEEDNQSELAKRKKSEEKISLKGKSPVACQNQLLKQVLKARAGSASARESLDVRNGYAIPTAAEKAQFRRSLDSATCMVFHRKTALPLTSSPAPLRKSGTCFDFDSSLTSISAIKRALFEKENESKDSNGNRVLSTSAPASMTTSNLLGNFEESVLNGRLEPVSTVEGFMAEIGASGSFCPKHTTLPVTVFFYTLQDIDKVTTPYLGHINLEDKGYHVPKKGTIQVTLFNPHWTVVKMFVVRYDLCDMPPNSQTFIRQRTLYMPTNASDSDPESRKWLRYLIHLRFASTKSCRIYLHTDIRMIIFRKSDLDAATSHGEPAYELRSFTQGPTNPRFSPCK